MATNDGFDWTADVQFTAGQFAFLSTFGLTGPATALLPDIRTVPGIDYTIVLVGSDSATSPNKASIFVRLTEVRARKPSQYQLMDRVRAEVLPRFASDNLRTSVSQASGVGGGGSSNKDVAYSLSGPDLRRLGDYARRIETALKKTAGVVDVDPLVAEAARSHHAVQQVRHVVAEMTAGASDELVAGCGAGLGAPASLGDASRGPGAHSHSLVPGGLVVMS